MKLLVITFTTPDGLSNAGLKHLTTSLEKHGYEYIVLSDKKFSWGGDNFKVIADWLKENRKDYTHILYTDAYDTLAMQPPAFIEQISTDKRMFYENWVFSAEKNDCFANNKSKYHTEKRWPFLCAGGYICPIDVYLYVIENEKRFAVENDQEYASRIFESQKHGVFLDLDCHMFQTLYNMKGLHQETNWGEFAINDKYEFVNLITGTKPAFIHGNGKVDMRSIYHHKYKSY